MVHWGSAALTVDYIVTDDGFTAGGGGGVDRDGDKREMENDYYEPE